MGLGLKSDGHGNGGALINGNGGTHDHLSKFRQPSYIIWAIPAETTILPSKSVPGP